MKRVFLSMLAALAVGCASKDVASISSSRFDYHHYKGMKIAVMPLLVEGTAKFAPVPEEQIRNALKEQLSVLQMSNTVAVTSEEAESVSFPYTPETLAKFGREKHYAAVVGATIVRMTQRPSRDRWSMSGTITFVDAENPKRHWAVAKSWDFVGSPTGIDAENQLATAFQRDFMAVRRAMLRDSVDRLLFRSTGVEDGGAILNLDLADASLEQGNWTRQTVSNASADASSVRGKALVDVFAIDDSGIVSLKIENRSVEKSEVMVWGDQPVLKRGFFGILPQRAVLPQSPERVASVTRAGLPIYLADRVPVRVKKGINDIVATVVNAAGRPVSRTVRLIAEAGDEKAVELMVVAATEFAAEGKPELVIDAAAKTRLDALEAQDSASTDGSERSYTYIAQDATRSKILRGITEEWARTDDGTRRVLAFVGRAEVLYGRPYLILHDTELMYPDIDSISVREFLELASLGIRRLSLDVCTNSNDPDQLRNAINAYVMTGRNGGVSTAQQSNSVQMNPVVTTVADMVPIPDVRIDVHVTADCSKPIGAQFLELATDELGASAAAP